MICLLLAVLAQAAPDWDAFVATASPPGSRTARTAEGVFQDTPGTGIRAICGWKPLAPGPVDCLGIGGTIYRNGPGGGWMYYLAAWFPSPGAMDLVEDARGQRERNLLLGKGSILGIKVGGTWEWFPVRADSARYDGARADYEGKVGTVYERGRAFIPEARLRALIADPDAEVRIRGNSWRLDAGQRAKLARFLDATASR